eukprot:887471-Amphidinium_carterae.1
MRKSKVSLKTSLKELRNSTHAIVEVFIHIFQNTHIGSLVAQQQRVLRDLAKRLDAHEVSHHRAIVYHLFRAVPQLHPSVHVLKAELAGALVEDIHESGNPWITAYHTVAAREHGELEQVELALRWHSEATVLEEPIARVLHRATITNDGFKDDLWIIPHLQRC